MHTLSKKQEVLAKYIFKFKELPLFKLSSSEQKLLLATKIGQLNYIWLKKRAHIDSVNRFKAPQIEYPLCFYNIKKLNDIKIRLEFFIFNQ